MSQYSQENTFVEVSFKKAACNFIKKRYQHIFSFEYCEISRNTYFEEHLRTAASEVTLGTDCLGLFFWTVAFKTVLT